MPNSLCFPQTSTQTLHQAALSLQVYDHRYKAFVDGVETDSVMEIDPHRRTVTFRTGNGSKEIVEVHDFKNASTNKGQGEDFFLRIFFSCLQQNDSGNVHILTFSCSWLTVILGQLRLCFAESRRQRLHLSPQRFTVECSSVRPLGTHLSPRKEKSEKVKRVLR